MIHGTIRLKTKRSEEWLKKLAKGLLESQMNKSGYVKMKTQECKVEKRKRNFKKYRK